MKQNHPDLSVRRQCSLLSLARSSLYYQPRGESAENLAFMEIIDKQFLETPWYRSRQMARHMRREGHQCGRHRVRRLLRAREVAIKMRMNTENTIRGLLASFGIRLPKHLQTYEQRVRKVLEGQTVLAGVIEPLLKLRTEALRQAAVLTKEMSHHARSDEACRRLMTIPGVGAVSAVTFVATIDTPDRFKRSRSVGAYIGLTSRRYQSGDIDFGGRISKRGDRMLRTVLYEAANSLLCRVKSGPGQPLQDWAMALKKRTSHKKAVVALARKLSVIMHAIWKDGTEFEAKGA